MCNTGKEKNQTQATLVEADPHDDRPLVKDLLDQHATSIQGVRQKILSDETIGKPLWDPERYDDIWILRFVLSHKGNIENASKSALKTMKMRDELKMNDNQSSDLRMRIKNYGGFETDDTIEPLPNYALYNSFFRKNSYLVISQPDPDRGVLVYGDMGGIDLEGMVTGMTEEQLKHHLIFLNEAMYQILDDVTRRTGKLTKVTRNVNLGNFSILQMNYKFAKRDAAVLKDIEEYHPQLLANAFFYNCPGWISAVWTAMRPLFPKRIAEKVDFLSVNASKKLHKPILSQVSEANLPEKFGGKNKEWPPPSIAETSSRPPRKST